MSGITWGYAVNQWKFGQDAFLRREHHESAFKTISVCGFREVELRVGTGRWEPLGHPVRVIDSYGSVGALAAVVRDCGLERVASSFWDPALPLLEEPSFGRSTTNPDDRDGIVGSARVFAEFLRTLGGSTLVVRPVGSRWRTGPLDDATLGVVAETWNAAGAATAEVGIRTALHLDCLSALQTPAEIAMLLDRTDPAAVTLALDTGELTLAGVDPVALYERHADRVGHIHLKDVKTTDTLDERLQPNAEHEFLTGGGSREIGRWFWELGVDGGLVDLPALYEALDRHGYRGSLIVECEGTPDPWLSTMLSGRHLQRRQAA